MTKVRDLNEEEKVEISADLDSGAALLGQDMWDTQKTFTKNEKLGLCNDCNYLESFNTEYGRIFARCRDMDIDLPNDRIVDCTRYVKKGTLTLQDMEKIAYIIEVGKKDIGFITEE